MGNRVKIYRMKVNVLCLGLREYKSRSLLLPLIRFRQKLRQSGIYIEIFTSDSERLSNCDAIIIEDRYYISGKKRRPELSKKQINRIKQLRDEVDQLLWFDTQDGTKIQLPMVIPYVDKYCKKDILKDKNLYKKPLHDFRLFSDYYQSNFDRCHGTDEERIVQATSKVDLSKLAQYWNLGYNIHTPAPDLFWKLLNNLPYTLSGKFPWKKIMDWTRLWTPVDADRPVDISGRFSTTYALDGVEFHRKLMEKRLQHRFDSEAVNSLAYWRELQQSKVLLSPFGYGEVCLRDFEGFMSGCVVVKPNMDHIETWPPVYEANKTMVSVPWNMSDIEEQVDQILENYAEYKQIAETGQKRYKKYLTGDSAPELFIDQFKSLM